MKLKDKKSCDKPRQHIKKQRRHFADKGHTVKAMDFLVVLYRCETQTMKKTECRKNWCFQTVVLEKTLESPLHFKETKPVNTKGSQPWILIERTDAEAEAPVLWPPDAKSQLTGKDPDTGKDWKHEENGMTEGKMLGWHN